MIDFKEFLGDYADGMIGAYFFKQSVLEISYEKEYIKIYETIDSVDITSYEKIPLLRHTYGIGLGYKNTDSLDKTLNKTIMRSKSYDRFYVPVEVYVDSSLTIKGNYTLDLGSGGSLNLTTQTAKKYNLDTKVNYKIPYYTIAGGIGGASSDCSFRSDSVRIGNFTLANVTMGYSNNRTGSLSKSSDLGLLGNDILDRFDIIIDFINNDLYLKPNARFGKPYKFSTLGFSYRNRSKTKGVWVVKGFYENCNAEQAGLKMNDEIIKVNGIDVTTVKLKEETKLLYQSDSLELTLKLDDSLTKTIKFKLDDRPNP